MHGLVQGRKILAIAFMAILLMGCAPRITDEQLQRVQEAQEVFDAAESPQDFLRAAQLYQQLHDAGIKSGAVYYNQGNAFMRAGQSGRAVACYRQAKRFRPRDPYLDANLRTALGGASSRPGGGLALLFFWQDWLSYREKFLVATVLALSALGFGLASLWRPSRRWLAPSIIGVSSCLLMTASAAVDWQRFDATRHGVVVREGVVARKGDSPSYEPAFTEPLRETTEFIVLEQRRDWFLIQLEDNQTGWAPRDGIVVY